MREYLRRSGIAHAQLGVISNSLEGFPEEKRKTDQLMSMARVGCGSVFVSIILVTLMQSVHGDTNSKDVESLRVFYRSMNSPPLTGWNDHGGDPCGDSWQGITCDLDGRNVTRIELPGLDLNGTLGWSSSLNRFQHLTVLDLSNNEIGGIIPNNLPINLKLLNLQRNHLKRNIPWSLGQLLSLTELRLAHNNLTGTIADNFGKLRSLITLDLSDNGFTGTIPKSVRNLSELRFLYLQDNRIDSGLHILTSLRLQTLDIRKNAFSGEEIPTQLMAIPSFQYSDDEFMINASLPHDQLNQSLAHSPTPAAHPPNTRTPAHPSEKTPPKKNSTESTPPPHHKNTTAPVPSPYQLQADVTDVRSQKGGESISFWSPLRIAGLIVASILALVASVLTFLYFKWKYLEEDVEHRKEDSEVSWLDLASLYPRQIKYR